MDWRYRRFQQQRKHAQERGIPWCLQFWEWLQIWEESGHLHERGCHKGQWVMARNGDAGAYEAKNIRIARVETNNREAAQTRWKGHMQNRAPASLVSQNDAGGVPSEQPH